MSEPAEDVQLCPEALPEGARFAVLASGSGTNLQALIETYPENIAVVAGDKKDALAFTRARQAGIPVEHVDPQGFATREDFDAELVERVLAYEPGLVVAAGYMRVLSGDFLGRAPDVINVHPSLLPEFKGLDAVGRALSAGVEQTGVTVHFAVAEVDSGPVLAQEAVAVRPGDTKSSLLGRLHPVEHRLLVGAVADYFWGRFSGKDLNWNR